jgi:hypothetical protein
MRFSIAEECALVGEPFAVPYLLEVGDEFLEGREGWLGDVDRIFGFHVVGLSFEQRIFMKSVSRGGAEARRKLVLGVGPIGIGVGIGIGIDT